MAFGRNSMGSRIPDTGARELSDFTSWKSVSSGLSQTYEGIKRLRKERDAISALYADNAQIRRTQNYAGFASSLGNIRGKIGGAAGGELDKAISAFLKDVHSKGGMNIDKGELSKLVETLKGSIEKLSSSATGVEKGLLDDLTSNLNEAIKNAAKGGFGSMGGNARDAIKSAYGFRANATIDDARKNLESEMNKAAVALGDPALKTALDNIRDEMNRAAEAAGNSADKQQAVADAASKIEGLKAGAKGADATVIDGIAKVASKNSVELRKALIAQGKDRRQLEFANRIGNLSHSIGVSFRTLVPIKRTIDLTNTIFQQINSKFNQFARMQMRIASERGGYGRLMRGAAMDFSSMMSALGTGRRAGMEDRVVVDRMATIQEQLARARWGEGPIIENMGKWGLTPFDENGNMKDYHQVMIDISEKFNSLGSQMEKLQFLSMQGFKPQEMEFVRDYAKDARRWATIKNSPEKWGVLENARYLDESGFSAKADAATKIELKRRQILNQNAIDDGFLSGLRRSLNPENWLFSDWTARQKGVQQAKGEMAMEKLTRAINERIIQAKKGDKDSRAGALIGLTASELAGLSALAKANESNLGEKSPTAAIDRAFTEQFGLKFDVRTPIEKLQAALIPLTTKIANGVDAIVNWIGKSSLAKTAMNHPIISTLGLALLLGGGKRIGGSVLRWGGGLLKSGLGKVFGGGGVAATSAAAKPGMFSRIRGWFSRSTPKGVAPSATTEVPPTSHVPSSATGGATSAEAGVHTASGGGSGGITSASETAAKPGMFSRIRGWFSRSTPKGVAPSATKASAEETLKQFNKSMGLGLVLDRGSGAKAGFDAFVAENPALMTGAAKTTAKAAGGAAKTVGGGVAKAGLKGLGGAALSALYFGYDAHSARQQYDTGDIKGGNNTLASSAGGIIGGFLGGAATGAAYGALAGSPTGPGAIITGIIGSIIGGIGGALGAGAISDAMSEHYAVGGSESAQRRLEGFRSKDNVVRDPAAATKNFLNGLREALRSNNTQKAMDMLAKNGIPGVDVEALKNSKEFMEDDTVANKTLHGAVMANALAQYAYKTGKSISLEDFLSTVQSDKYYSTATQLGVSTTNRDLVNLALRGTGNEAPAPTYAVMDAYVKNGWKTDKEGLMAAETAIRNENPEMSAAQVRQAAEQQVREKHFKNLTSADIQNYTESMDEYNRLQIEHADLVNTAARYGISSTGIIRNHKGDMIDTEGYLVDSNGARIDRKGRHEGEEGYEAKKVGKALQGEALEAYNRLQAFRQDHAGADRMTMNRRSLEEAQEFISGTNEERQAAALKNLKRMGMDVENREFSQKFESEQIKELNDALFNVPDTEEMSVSGKLAKFASDHKISINQARNLLGKSSLAGATVESTYEYQQGSDYKAKQKAEAAKQKKQKKAQEYAKIANNATEAQINEAFKENGDYEYYMALNDKVKAGETLTDTERESYEKYQKTIATSIQKGKRKKAPPLHKKYVPTAKEQAAIAKTTATNIRLKKEQEKAKNRPPLAQISDMKRMESLAKGGMTERELARRFGPQRARQFRAEIKTGRIEDPFSSPAARKRANAQAARDARNKKKGVVFSGYSTEEKIRRRRSGEQVPMSREEYEKRQRAGLEATGMSKERIDAVMKDRMEVYDATHKSGGAKGSAPETSVASNKKSLPAEQGGSGSPTGASKVMQEKSGIVATQTMMAKTDAAEQVSAIMSQKGAAAESAAESAKKANESGNAGAKNITINLGGQQITQNIQGEHTMDKDGMKTGTIQGASEIKDKTAEAIVSVMQSKGSY